MLLAGCASTTGGTTSRWPGMTHGTVGTHMEDVAMVGALPAQVTVSQLNAGGVSELRDDWTEAARTHAREVLEHMTPQHVVYLGDLESRPELADEIREVKALYALIDANIMLFGLSPMAVPTPHFEYSVGSIDGILEAAHADALLVIGGKDDIFSTDRKVLTVVSIIASAALTGQAVAPGDGTAHLSAALIARDGTILWWNFLGNGEISDLRTPNGMQATIHRLLASMPQALGRPVPDAAVAATSPPPASAVVPAPAPDTASGEPNATNPPNRN